MKINVNPELTKKIDEVITKDYGFDAKILTEEVMKLKVFMWNFKHEQEISRYKIFSDYILFMIKRLSSITSTLAKMSDDEPNFDTRHKYLVAMIDNHQILDGLDDVNNQLQSYSHDYYRSQL